ALEVFLRCRCRCWSASTAATTASGALPCGCRRTRSRNHLEWVVITTVYDCGLGFISGDRDNNISPFFSNLSKSAIAALEWSIRRLARAVSDYHKRQPGCFVPLHWDVQMVRDTFSGSGKCIGALLIPFGLILRIFGIGLGRLRAQNGGRHRQDGNEH